ncbi:hypothetical protein Tco_0378597 [Tanacetum coccineum]
MFRRLWWLIRHPQPATAAAAAGKAAAVVVLLAVMRRRGGGEGWNGWRVRRSFARDPKLDRNGRKRIRIRSDAARKTRFAKGFISVPPAVVADPPPTARHGSDSGWRLVVGGVEVAVEEWCGGCGSAVVGGRSWPEKGARDDRGDDDRCPTGYDLDAELDRPRSHGGTIAQTRSERVPTPSYDSPLLGGNIPESDEERLEHQDDLTDFVPPTPYDSPLSGGHTPGSDEGRPNINELMAICTNLSNRVLALETSKTAQDLVINKLKKKVKRLEKSANGKLRDKLLQIGTSREKLDKENNVEGDTVNAAGAVSTATTRVSAASASVTTAGVSISTAELRTPPTTTTTAFEDEDLTIAQTLVKMRSEKAKKKRVAFKDVEESTRSTTILPTIDLKDKGKGIIAEQSRNKPPTRAQLRNKMVTYLKHMGKYTHNQMKSKNFEEIQKLYEREQKWINDFVPVDSEVVKDSRKGFQDHNLRVEESLDSILPSDPRCSTSNVVSAAGTKVTTVGATIAVNNAQGVNTATLKLDNEFLQQDQSDDLEEMDLSEHAILTIRKELNLTSPRWSVSTATRDDTLQGSVGHPGIKTAEQGAYLKDCTVEELTQNP